MDTAKPFENNQDVAVMFFARGKSRWVEESYIPQVRDVRNATSLLWGFPTCEQREVMIILGPDGKVAWNGRSRSAMPKVAAQVKRLAAKANGLLHDLDIPEKHLPGMLKAYRAGQLAQLEILAKKMTHDKTARPVAMQLLERITKDRDDRVTEITKLFEDKKISDALMAADSFRTTYPRARENRDIQKMTLKARKDKTTRHIIEAKMLYDKCMIAWGKNQDAQPKEFERLQKLYPDTYWARLAKYLWMDNNNKAGTPIPEKKKR